ncbi:MAG: C-terminal binding protein [Planctomycetaceae bacterium]|nr:C-terminal binding protein [Planctomycetaceae bacterium]MCB9951299.1 C-terminal binding protein [Planctomycetaceae bacterium]
MKPQVVITDFINPPLDIEQRILGDLADVVALNAFSEEDILDKVENAEAIMLYHFISISRRTIERLKNCKLIVRCGVGFDNVDRLAAREKGIAVANVPDYGSEEVADSAIGMYLSLARGIHYANHRLQRKQGPWIYEQVRPLHRIRGRVFGVIGVGRIGTAAALRAKALGMRVLFYDPYVPDGRDKALGIERCETLEELLAVSDAVSVHCPRTEETQHIMNAQTIGLMKESAFLINTARGGCVDANAVVEALAANKIRGAALDVLEVEPPLDDDPVMQAWRNPEHPAHDRLIINPHSAFYSEEGLDDMRIKGSENCRRVLEGKPPRNVVN